MSTTATRDRVASAAGAHTTLRCTLTHTIRLRRPCCCCSDDVVLDADGRHPKYAEAVNNVKVWGRGEDASFFKMLPAWLSQLPPEWDVLRFSTFTTFCLQDLLRGPSPIFHAVRHAQPCDGANSSWAMLPAPPDDDVPKQYLGNHANLVSRAGARNLLSSMWGCGVGMQDLCGYQEEEPNQGTSTGRPFRSYSIPTPRVLTAGSSTIQVPRTSGR